MAEPWSGFSREEQVDVPSANQPCRWIHLSGNRQGISWTNRDTDTATGNPDGNVHITPPISSCAGVWELSVNRMTLAAQDWTGDWGFPWSILK